MLVFIPLRKSFLLTPNLLLMTILKAILIIIGIYIAAVVVFDIIGILANSFFDIFAGRSKSTLLYYSVWFVAAIFAGLFFSTISYDYINKNDFFKNNSWMLMVISIVLTALLIV
jgi:hypothetical protein